MQQQTFGEVQPAGPPAALAGRAWAAWDLSVAAAAAGGGRLSASESVPNRRALRGGRNLKSKASELSKGGPTAVPESLSLSPSHRHGDGVSQLGGGSLADSRHWQAANLLPAESRQQPERRGPSER